MKTARAFAYLRVSTDDQTTQNQKLAILEYASKEKIQIDDWIEVSASSRKSIKERKVDFLLSRITDGDTLIISEISRLGRSVGQIIMVIDDLVKNGVTVIFLKEGLKLNGERDIQSKVMLTMFGLFAEIERDLISERTKEGLARAKAEGKLVGRPKGAGRSKLDKHREEIKSLLKNGATKTFIAKKFGTTTPNLYNWLKKNDIADK